MRWRAAYLQDKPPYGHLGKLSKAGIFEVTLVCAFGGRREYPRCVSSVLLLALSTLIGACSGDTFPQYPGFDAIRQSLSSEPPTFAERRLLERHKPVLYVAPEAEGPIDFYRDYIANGSLYDATGKLLSESPNRRLLNALKHQSQAQFVHRHSGAPLVKPMPTVYAGVYRATLALPDQSPQVLTFLSYHFVFRYSGIPAGIPASWKVIADLLGDSQDWHQLDHYTAAFVVLDEKQIPIAVMLQQHNRMRTYLIGDDPAFVASQSSAAIAIDAAIASNELYPHREGETQWPAVSYITPANVGYLTGVESYSANWWRGLHGVMDVTYGARQVDYALQFLPPDDAFYVFEGALGEYRLLPGRGPPPGAIYRTLPSLWPLEIALYVFYWWAEDADYVRIVRDFWGEDGELSKAAHEQLKARFALALQGQSRGVRQQD